MKKKENRVLKLSKETLRALDGHVLRDAHGGGNTLGCATASICSECETIIGCPTERGYTCDSEC
jgi:hypothetical protein